MFRAQQERFPFYRFVDVDADRYTVGSDPEQATMVALRELDAGNIPDRSWTNRHLVYTHGYGPVAITANLQSDGEPSYLVSEIPLTGELAEATQPGVYFGEDMTGYAVVDTKVAEQEAASGTETEQTRYEGDAGVQMSSFLRKSALALRFGDWNLFVSGQLTDESRVLYKRDVARTRPHGRTVPPLRLGPVPGPRRTGRILWVIDAYTTTDRYPYSQSMTPSNLPDGSGLDTDLNYVRNSVKATVDAYDGTIRFYVIDDVDDPIIRAYQKAFPELFSAESDMPEGLREHWRYPEDMFRAQTEQFTPVPHDRHQRLLPQAVHLGHRAAPRARGRGRRRRAPPQRARTVVGTRRSPRRNTPIEPLYLTMQLPGSDEQEFVLTRPYVPRGKANQLSAFMVARMDGENYGKLVSYEIPDVAGCALAGAGRDADRVRPRDQRDAFADRPARVHGACAATCS